MMRDASLDMNYFGAAGDWGPRLFSVLYATAVGLPTNGDQFGLEGAGDIR